RGFTQPLTIADAHARHASVRRHRGCHDHHLVSRTLTGPLPPPLRQVCFLSRSGRMTSGRASRGSPMVVLNRIYTRTGDDGSTALGTGERRPKFDLRIAAYGTVDETNAAVGIARLH